MDLALTFDIFEPKMPPLFGMDISSSSVKMVELMDAGKGAIRVERYAIEALPKDSVVDGNIANLEAVVEAVKKHPKADSANPNHISAPMPGKVSAVVVKPNQRVKAGDRLLSIEAMKMETAVYSPKDATVGEVLVEPGAVIEARDLLVVIKD